MDSRAPFYLPAPSLAQTVLASIPDGVLGVHRLKKLAEVSWRNAATLSLIHENNHNLSVLFLLCDSIIEDWSYCVEHLRDILCLALLMRNNTKINILGICDDMLDCGDLMAHFFRTLEGNNSIRKLTVLSATLTDSSETLSNFDNLASFIKSHKPLAEIEFASSDMPVEAWNALPRTLEECAGRSLHLFKLSGCNIGDEQLGRIVTALSAHQQLEVLGLQLHAPHGSTNRATHLALATGLKTGFSNLKTLELDSHLANVVEAITNGSKIEHLILHRDFFENTHEGWQVLKKLLCDTSSINKTFFSNHSVHKISAPLVLLQVPSDIQILLDLNRLVNKNDVSKMKIVQHHSDFDLSNLFQWDLKALPLILEWLQAANNLAGDNNVRIDCSRRKLSTLYQYARKMPSSFVTALAIPDYL